MRPNYYKYYKNNEEILSVAITETGLEVNVLLH
jgi:hypothetical protein